MIKNPKDIKKAYKMGFECLGYPSEIAKKISLEEYNKLLINGFCD